MKNELGWFIPTRARGQSISSHSLDPGDRWSSSFPRPLPAQPIFDYLSDPNPLHTDQSLFLLLKTQAPCGIEGLSFIHPSSQRRLPDHLVWARLCAGCLERGCDGDRETFCDHQGESFVILRIMCLDQGTCPGAHRGLLHGLVWRQDRLPHILYYLFHLSALSTYFSRISQLLVTFAALNWSVDECRVFESTRTVSSDIPPATWSAIFFKGTLWGTVRVKRDPSGESGDLAQFVGLSQNSILILGMLVLLSVSLSFSLRKSRNCSDDFKCLSVLIFSKYFLSGRSPQDEEREKLFLPVI